MTFCVRRIYWNDEKHGPDKIDTGLTLLEAQLLCKDSEGSSRTCKLPINVERTERCGPWFLSYDSEE